MSAVDLYAVQFWGFVVLAVLVLVPLTNASARKWAFAGLNLGFLSLHTEPGQAIAILPVVLGLIIAWATLRAVPRARSPRWLLAIGGAVVLGLFLLHKLPHAAARIGATQAESVLAAVGFSYVALRLIDVARAVADGRRKPPDLPSTINYLLPFHMLAAGPIQSYDDFADQPAVPPAPTAARSLAAIERIVWGLFKKYIIANYIDRLFLTGFHARGPYFLLEVQLNFLWLYFDFSAYSDVAVGLGGLLGVATPENFNRPYLARNVTEFWERWHISLSQFIRRHLFIPIQLALMRRFEGRSPQHIAGVAIFASFVVCGLWHGITWPWFAWGVFQGAGLVVCVYYRQYLTRRLKRKGVNIYLANPWIRAAAIVLTFEFAAAAVAIATYPYQEIPWWTSSPH